MPAQQQPTGQRDQQQQHHPADRFDPAMQRLLRALAAEADRRRNQVQPLAATFKTNAVLPVPGRPASVIISPECKPPVIAFSLSNGVRIVFILTPSSALRIISATISRMSWRPATALPANTLSMIRAASFAASFTSVATLWALSKRAMDACITDLRSDKSRTVLASESVPVAGAFCRRSESCMELMVDPDSARTM